MKIYNGVQFRKKTCMTLMALSLAGCASVDTLKQGEGQPPTASAPAVAQADSASANPQKMDANNPKDIQRGVELLQHAVSKAMKEGKTSIDIDTEALLSPAAKGDMVTVRFTARDTSGAPLFLPESMAKQDTPQEVIAGNEELFPGLGDAVIGMAAGEKKHITLTPEKAFGPRDPAKTSDFQIKRTTPVKITMSADEYVKRFGGFPEVGKEVPLAAPYLTTKVTGIGEKDVTLAFSASDKLRFTEPYGTLTVSVGQDNITMKLEPKLGGPFTDGNRQGVIIASDNKKFTVDFNHPLAGKAIEVDLEVDSITKAADLKAVSIDWIEDHLPG